MFENRALWLVDPDRPIFGFESWIETDNRFSQRIFLSLLMAFQLASALTPRLRPLLLPSLHRLQLRPKLPPLDRGSLARYRLSITSASTRVS